MRKAILTRLNIHVTKTDIARGTPDDQRRCPIALAAKRATGKPCAVWGGMIEVQGRPDPYELPGQARRFIDRFDEERPVRPFRVSLRVSRPLS